MQHAVFLVGDVTSKIRDDLVSGGAYLIDMTIVRERYPNIKSSFTGDSILRSTFDTRLREAPLRLDIVVSSYPETEGQAKELARLLREYRVRFVLGENVTPEFRAFLRTNFHTAVVTK